jgi:hypothetical protein
VHLTSEVPWRPNDTSYAETEAVLREHLERDYAFPYGPAVSQLRSRGQIEGTPRAKRVKFAAEATTFDPLQFAVQVPDTSDDEASIEGTPHQGNDLSSVIGAAAVGPGKAELARPQSPTGPLQETKLTLMQLHKESRHCAAIDVDRAAATLLDQCTPFHETDPDQFRTIEALASHLASATSTKKRRGFVTPAKLAERWGIGLETAKKTIESTTQLAVRDFTHSWKGRRMKPYAWQLHHPRRNTKAYSDTLFAKCKSLRGNTMAQVFYCEGSHTTHVFPMKKKSEAHIGLDDFFEKMGVPHTIAPDNAKEMTLGEWKRKCQKHSVSLKPIEPHNPNQNLAEGSAIRELKRQYRKLRLKKNFPEVVWDYALEWIAQTRSHTALNIQALDGQVPMCKLTGDTPDISHLAEFGFWDWVWYWVPQPKGPETDMLTKSLGKYIGPEINAGDAMTSRVLAPSGEVVHRSSVAPLTDEEEADPENDRRKEDYLAALKSRLKERAKDIKLKGHDKKEAKEYSADDAEVTNWLWDSDEEPGDYIPYEPIDSSELPWDPPEGHEEEKPDVLPEIAEADDIDFDKHISAKVALPQGGHGFAKGVVLKRVRDQDGLLVGHSNSNPLLDTSQYEVQLEDGAVERYSANMIAEHICSQVDGDGHGQGDPVG